MSIDGLGPAFNPHARPGDKPEFPGFPGFPPRPPADMPYPFPPFPGFPNGLHPKMNEISVIQSLNGGMPVPPHIAEAMKAHSASMSDAVKPLPPTSHTDFMKSEAMKNLMKVEPKESALRSPLKHSDSEKEHNNNERLNGGSGELDLSMNKTPEGRASKSPRPGDAGSPPRLPGLDKTPEFLRMPPGSLPLHFSSPFPPHGLLGSLPSSFASPIAPLNMPASSSSTDQTSPSSSTSSNSPNMPGGTSVHMQMTAQRADSHRPMSPPAWSQRDSWAWKMKGHLQRPEASSPTPLMT